MVITVNKEYKEEEDKRWFHTTCVLEQSACFSYVLEDSTTLSVIIPAYRYTLCPRFREYISIFQDKPIRPHVIGHNYNRSRYIFFLFSILCTVCTSLLLVHVICLDRKQYDFI